MSERVCLESMRGALRRDKRRSGSWISRGRRREGDRVAFRVLTAAAAAVLRQNALLQLSSSHGHHSRQPGRGRSSHAAWPVTLSVGVNMECIDGAVVVFRVL